jgi:hypothetical protein
VIRKGEEGESDKSRGEGEYWVREERESCRTVERGSEY